MAITVNGAVLRNMPEQISKNVEDIADHEDRLSTIEGDFAGDLALNNVAISGDATISGDSTLNNLTVIGDTVLGNDASDTLNVTGAVDIAGDTEITGATTINGNTNVNGNFDVSGTANIGMLTFTDANIAGSMVVGGDFSVAGTVTMGTFTFTNANIAGNMAVSGDLAVTGKAKTFEKIVDSNGNYRFLEDNITLTAPAGVTYNYAKWSLSGTHLMIVIAGSVTNGSEFTDGLVLGSIRFPSWIYNKIYPVFATNRIEIKEFDMRDSNWGNQSITLMLTKSASPYLSVRVTNGGVTLDADRGFRFQFDLLIDNS